MGCAQNLLLSTRGAPGKATSIQNLSQNLSLSAHRAIALNNKLSSSSLVLFLILRILQLTFRLLAIYRRSLYSRVYSHFPIRPLMGFRIDSHYSRVRALYVYAYRTSLQVRHVVKAGRNRVITLSH